MTKKPASVCELWALMSSRVSIRGLRFSNRFQLPDPGECMRCGAWVIQRNSAKNLGEIEKVVEGNVGKPKAGSSNHEIPEARGAQMS